MKQTLLLTAVAALGLGGCDRLGTDGNAVAEANTSNATAGNDSASQPRQVVVSDAGVTRSRSFAGLLGTQDGGKDPVDAPAGQPLADSGPAVDRAMFVGRWSDDGDCKMAVEFRPDGSFITADGGGGRWSLAGRTLTLTGGSDASLRFTVREVRGDRILYVDADGAAGQSTRC